MTQTDRIKIGSSPSGLLTIWYNTDTETLVFTMRGARMWRFLVDSEGTLDQFAELAEAAMPQASAADLMWICDCLRAAEIWLETCPYDLARFGEIGVSF